MPKTKKVTTIKQAIDSFLLSCKVEGNTLKAYSAETIFSKLGRKTGIAIYPHLLIHTFATLWLKNSGDSLMLQRLLGHTTLMMTNRYCQAVGCEDAVEAHRTYSPID